MITTRTRRIFTRYGWACLSLTAVLLTLIGGVNAFIDPYNVFGSPPVARMSVLKPEVAPHVRITKAYEVWRTRPKTLILGSSRAEYGIDPAHPLWRHKPVYNLALPGTAIYEIRRYFEHATAVANVKTVVLFADLHCFNAYRPLNESFVENRLARTADGRTGFKFAGDLLGLLFSRDALESSWVTLRKQSSTEPMHSYAGGGFRQLAPFRAKVEKAGGVRMAFFSSEIEYFSDIWFPKGVSRFDFSRSPTGQQSFEHLEAIVKRCQAEGIELSIAISPIHARLCEAMRIAGLWDEFEAMKRRIVAIAARGGGPTRTIPVWDFSGYNSVSTEPVPARGDAATQMRWYLDSSHYSPACGDLMLRKMLGSEPEAAAVPGDFGRQIDPGNLEAHLIQINERRSAYAEANPQELVELRQLAVKYGNFVKEAPPNAGAP